MQNMLEMTQLGYIETNANTIQTRFVSSKISMYLNEHWIFPTLSLSLDANLNQTSQTLIWLFSFSLSTLFVIRSKLKLNTIKSNLILIIFVPSQHHSMDNLSLIYSQTSRPIYSYCSHMCLDNISPSCDYNPLLAFERRYCMLMLYIYPLYNWPVSCIYYKIIRNHIMGTL